MLKIKPGRLAIVVAIAILIAGPADATAQVRSTRPAPGAPGTWRLLGQVQARFTVDHDVIIVRGPYDNFRRLKFKVTGAPLKMREMIVTYDNGVPDRIPTRFSIPQGGESRVIDLRGAGQRSLRKVEFWYETAGMTRGRADVTLFGMK